MVSAVVYSAESVVVYSVVSVVVYSVVSIVVCSGAAVLKYYFINIVSLGFICN